MCKRRSASCAWNEMYENNSTKSEIMQGYKLFLEHNSARVMLYSNRKPYSDRKKILLFLQLMK